MVLLTDKFYYQTKKIKLGLVKLSPGFSMLSKWLAKRYGIKMVNAEFNKMPNSKEIYRLYIVLDSTEDFNKMHSSRFVQNRSYQKTIAKKFSRIALETKLAVPATLTNICVLYNDFSEEARTEANWKTEKEFRRILMSKYPDSWDVLAMFSSMVVFFFEESQISKNERNGDAVKIRADYWEVLKKYDEMNYYKEKDVMLRFDSKENLDKNYAGNLFYYAK